MKSQTAKTPELRQSPAGVPASGVIEIDLDALANNYRLLQERAKGAECAAAVKANAYGIGIDVAAPCLWEAGCRTFFVATLDEGVELRALLAGARIYVLNGIFPGEERFFADHELCPVLNSADQVELWRKGPAAASSAGPLAALHIDTGMNRLGMPQAEGAALLDGTAELEIAGIGMVMSHLVSAERPADAMNRQQLAAFRDLASRASGVPLSLANSAGVFLGPEYHFDMVRVGISLYGGAPVAGEANPMRPVVRLRARILQERRALAGETVGYDALFRLGRESRLITIAAGYADGLPTVFTNRGFVAIEGQRAPIVGRVSMDLITADVTDLPGELGKPGEWVDLIGPGASVDDVAESAGLISYEVLTSLSRRFERVHTGGSGDRG